MSSFDLIKIRDCLGLDKGYSICKELMFIELSIVFNKSTVAANVARLKSLIDYIEFAHSKNDNVKEIVDMIQHKINELTVDMHA